MHYPLTIPEAGNERLTAITPGLEITFTRRFHLGGA